MPNERSSEDFARILRHLGKVLRVELDRAMTEVPPAQVMHQMIRLVHARQDDGRIVGLSRAATDDLPEDLRQLLEQIALLEKGDASEPTDL
jgi:hypothetical protein